MKVTLIQNSNLAGPGLLEEYVVARGGRVEALVSFRDIVATPFENLESDLVIILGSPRGVYEDAEAWIAREHAMVAHLVARDIPILGICFGAQLVAKVHGARVAPMGRRYQGWLENDTITGDHLRGPWLRWHGDRIFAAPQLETLATADGILQAFRNGRTIGLQFHPEATGAILLQWINGLDEPLRQAAKDTALAYYAANEDAIRARSFRLFDTIFDELLAPRPGTRRSEKA